MKFPLSPQRAKGLTLNIEGRRAAGLDAEFVAKLDVYSQSKGRTPAVFVFNPFAEGYIARGKGFTPVKHQSMLARDLANLPQFLCRADDIVLVPKRPSVGFLSTIKQAGFPLPEFAELKNGRIDPNSDLSRRKLSGLRPWAWGPDSLELLEPLGANLGGPQRTVAQYFNPPIAELYSKAWSANVLKRVLARDASWLCTEREAGITASTFEEAIEAITAIRRGGHHKIVAKQALGLAGHNAIRLWEPDISASQHQWLSRAMQNSRQLVIEPWLEREFDFSAQLEMGSRHLKLCGYTGLINDNKGQFRANWAAPNHNRRLPANVTALFPDLPNIAGQLQQLYTGIFSLLETQLRDAGFTGPIGIDAFVYRMPEGSCHLKPIVEINPRYTMGRLTLELMKQTCPGSYGLFRLVTRAEMEAEGFADFAAYTRSLSDRFPLRLEGEPCPKIREGSLCLNNPIEAQVCLATFQVSRHREELKI